MADVVEKMRSTVSCRALATARDALLLMVSGGSDSTALAYAACELSRAGVLGPVRILHVNHQLRGADADADERFVCRLADILGVEFVSRRIDIGRIAREEGANVEAVARRERYRAAGEVLQAWLSDLAEEDERGDVALGGAARRGRILVAHTQDDRVETFFMRSIVGTGPGGFRAMRYENGQVIRPLLDASREDLRQYVLDRAALGLPVARDDAGALWREDATNAHTDLFRAYVRHEIVPLAKARNPKLLDTLCRSMNLIADEDDMLERAAYDVLCADVRWVFPDGSHLEAFALGGAREAGLSDRSCACLFVPAFCARPAPLRRRAIMRVLSHLLGPDARIETASVEAVMAACEGGAPRSGYVANIQGDLAVSANKRGVLVEPMAVFRARRKRS